MASIFDTLTDRKKAADALTALLKSCPDFGEFEVVEVLKMARMSDVFVLDWAGQKVIAKHFKTASANETVLKLQRELDTLSPRMNSGPYQVNRCLLALPDVGIAILSFAPGPLLGAAIDAAAGTPRSDLIRHAGHWLAFYSEGRRRNATFGPQYWIKQLRAKDTSHITDGADRVLLERVLQHMVQQIDILAGAPIAQVATHPDFVGINATYQNGVIYGFDVQGECWLAQTRTAARFLVWQQIKNPDTPTETIAGIDRADATAFLSSSVIPENEQDHIFPFFIAEQLYRRYLALYQNDRIRNRIRHAMESIIQKEYDASRR